MLAFEGRTSQKISIPGKPIDTGFKLFGMSSDGYLYTWEATRPGLNEGAILDGNRFFVTIPGTTIQTPLTPTQAVVIRLSKVLDGLIAEGKRFHLYLDNLFTSWKLCYYLQEKGISITGTVRKGAAGFPPRLLALKNVNTALAWGAIQATILAGNVAAFVWQDNNLVMGIYRYLYLYRQL
jgi:Transposase IS4